MVEYFFENKKEIKMLEIQKNQNFDKIVKNDKISFFAFCFLLLVTFSIVACEDTVYTPKPRGYPKVEYPEKAYQKLDRNYCHFSFEYPKYAQIVQDTSYFHEKPANECWFDIEFPQYNARIHCTYYPIDKVNPFSKLLSDAFTLAGKHNIKADYIDEIKIEKSNHVSGFLFDIQGPTASPFQFYLTDSTKNFVRGALYFRTTSTRPDSLRPVVNFIKKDIIQMVNTFEWSK